LTNKEDFWLGIVIHYYASLAKKSLRFSIIGRILLSIVLTLAMPQPYISKKEARSGMR